MKKVKKGMLNGSDKGFSLIEVLCAVVLLGLIAAPFLQMIYSSYSMNQKSKKYLAAADLCQAVMEGVSAQTYEDSTTIGSTSETIQGLGNYYFGTSKLGVKGLYGSPKSGSSSTIPQGDCSSNPDGDAFLGTRDKTAYFTNVTYGGYKFNVTITAKEYTGDGTETDPHPVYPSSGKTYFTIPIEVSVYDVQAGVSFISSNLDQFKKIQTASTQIPNKR